MKHQPGLQTAAFKVVVGMAPLLLGACASAPPPPDWQANAFASLNSFTSAYLSGNTRVADYELARARVEIARTGRPDLMARAELVHCAAQVASLELVPCMAYEALAADAQAPEQTYAAFLAGQWSDIQPEKLPLHYRGLLALARRNAIGIPAPAPIAQPTSPLAQIQDPLARLIAAGLLLKMEQLTPTDIALAVDSASNQGWRRPVLAWLGVQHRRAQNAGDTAAAASVQRRIDLVLQTAPGKP